MSDYQSDEAQRLTALDNENAELRAEIRRLRDMLALRSPPGSGVAGLIDDILRGDVKPMQSGVVE